MGASDTLRILAPLLLLPMLLGCADVDYRDRSTLVHTRYATVENFGGEQIEAEQIDDLLASWKNDGSPNRGLNVVTEDSQPRP